MLVSEKTFTSEAFITMDGSEILGEFREIL